MLYLLTIIAIAFVWIVVSTSKLHWHPFLSITVAALLVGLALGLGAKEVVSVASRGFGDILASIGIVIVLGGVLGNMMEQSRAAETIALAILRGLGKHYPMQSLAFMGALVGIPVFCDAGFIILAKLTEAVSNKSRVNPIGLSLGLAAGLYGTHTLVPPTPGPIAAAGTLNADPYLGLVIVLGLAITVVSLPILVFVIQKLVKNMVVLENAQLSDEEVLDRAHPSLFAALLPIAIPLILIGLGTITNMLQWESNILSFVGNPIVALLISILVSFFVLKIESNSLFETLVGKALIQAGPILIITGAGGAFGAVLKASELTAVLRESMISIGADGWVLIIIAFLIAALLKSAKGSSTAAIVIASAIIAPFLSDTFLTSPFLTTLVIMSIGGGAMTFSHTNDSFFWVVTQLTKLSVKDAYRSYSLMTAIQGITILLIVSILYLIHQVV